MAKPNGGDIEGRIGFDDRGFILNTEEPPYSAICWIRSEWADGDFGYGTGFIFGQRTIFTAAHMVYKKGVGMATKIQAIPGLVDLDAPFAWATLSGRSARAHPAWIKSEDRANDLAALLLPGDLGLRTGWSDLGPVEVYNGLQINATGYALDYQFATGKYRQAQAGGEMWGQRSMGWRCTMPTVMSAPVAGRSGAYRTLRLT